MSSVEAFPTASCPNCGTALAADELADGGPAICAYCSHPFWFQPKGDVPRVSRKAVASLVLGIASIFFFCLTAIPALILAVLALVDLHRRRYQLRGRNLALAGIVLAIICGFSSLVFWALILPALQMLHGGRP